MPVPAQDELHGFDEEGMRRAVRSIRYTENRPGNLRREGPRGPGLIPQAIYMAQNSAYQANNTTAATWSVYAGATAGSETVTQLTGLSVYCRNGLILPNVFYKIFELNGRLEVLDPEMIIQGVVASDVNPDNPSGDFTIYTGTFGSETSIGKVLNPVYNQSSCIIKANKLAWAYWFRQNAGWAFIQGHTS